VGRRASSPTRSGSRRADRSETGDRNRFVGLFGVFGSTLFFVVILAEWLPVLVLGPCW
jgi:hypothetical protein